MKLPLTPSQSRLLAVLLLLLTVSLLIAAIALPVWKLHQRYDNDLESFGNRLSRYRQVASLRPSIEEAIGKVTERNHQKYFLKGNTQAVAASELQGMVTRVIENNKGRVFSSQILPAKEEAKPGEPAKIGITLQITAATVPLQLILHALEANVPYIFIEQLKIRSNYARTYKAIPGVQPEFSMQLTVYGFVGSVATDKAKP